MYTVYKLATGKILRLLHVAGHDISSNIKTGEDFIVGASNELTQYVNNGVVAERPEQDTVLCGCTLSSLPCPCTIQINCTVYHCDQVTEEIILDQYGIYEIFIASWPYKNKEFTIDYNAP